MTNWIEPPPTEITAEVQSLGLHPLVAETLARRGFTTREAVKSFINPDDYRPCPASALPDLEEALPRLKQAIRQGESIWIWGDFDVDGQTATAILFETLKSLGANVQYHIPVRSQEGHGVNLTWLKQIIHHGANVVLTCDTGIQAHREVDYARSMNVDVIITDHHDLPDELPAALGVINPKRLEKEHPLASLAGSGVAYKLAEALLEDEHATNTPAGLLDLVALGLVADVADLAADTRFLVQKGLDVLRSTKRPGLRQIMENARIDPAQLTETHIGFELAPRMNALGRLGDANPAVELLTTGSLARARLLATRLEGLNIQRRLLSDQVYEAAMARLRADPELLAKPAIVLAHPAWPAGVLGIAASRLVERYRRPVILLTCPSSQPAHGSARSIEGINITEAIASQAGLVDSFGGHPMAAGLSLAAEKIPAFQHGLEQVLSSMRIDFQSEPTLEIDCWLALPEATRELAEATRILAPFGRGNPNLVFAARNLNLKSATPIGRTGEHLRMVVEDSNSNTMEVLWWDGAREGPPGQEFDLAFTLHANDYRGTPRVTAELIGHRFIQEKPVELKTREMEVIDLRHAKNPLDEIKKLPHETLIWAEGETGKAINGKRRNQLSPCPALAIWTSPPGPAEIRQAMAVARPAVVYLFAVAAEELTCETFLTRLAGLMKYALNKRSGSANLEDLAGMLMAREVAVRAGLEWLSASGKFSFQENPPGEIQIGASEYQQEEQSRQQWFEALDFILQESKAYREYYATAPDEALLP